MSIYLGIDTSNYTTSLSLYNSDNGKMYMKRRLLPVKEGERGLRQSDCVFLHNKALPELFSELINEIKKDGLDIRDIQAIGVSSKPVRSEKSYMPCFTLGLSYAKTISGILNVPLFEFSHQEGHIAAAVYSLDENARAKFSGRFVAMHISGGTSDCLTVESDGGGYCAKRCGGTLDLNFGQAVDRTGVRLGFAFPCGKEMQEYALKSAKKYSPKISVNGLDYHVSGLENMAEKMIDAGEDKGDVCRFVFDYTADTLIKVIENIRKTDKSPVLLAGGVMSNSIIRERILSKFECDDIFFSASVYSSDNACGIAYLTKSAVEK